MQSTDKTSEVKVHLWTQGISIDLPEESTDENLPGENHLTFDEADELRDQVNEAWLNRHGFESASVAWSDVEAGDIIPSLGLILASSPYPTDTDESFGTAHFIGKGGKLTLPFSIEVTVHRRIQ